MTTEEVIKFWGSPVKAAKALGINRAAIAQWGDEPPALRQFQIQLLTNGQLLASQPAAGQPPTGEAA